MPLRVSCDGLYFPTDEPRDNVITLKYKPAAAGEQLPAHSLLIYKSKCTAPQLFHVLPRYGALLLTDGNGGASGAGYGTGTITFGLRDGPTSHHARENSETHTATPGGSTTNNSRKYQQRFALEYMVLVSEPHAHEQVAQALADPLRTTEVVKGLWSLATARHIPAEHIQQQSTISLKVYMQHVLLKPSGAAKADAATVLVPPEAVLLPPTLQERLGSANSPAVATPPHNTNNTSTNNVNNNNTGSSGRNSNSSRRQSMTGGTVVDNELRALRDQISSLRDGATTTPVRQTPPGTYSPTMSAAAAVGSGYASTNAQAPAAAAAGGKKEEEDILMPWPIKSSEDSSSADGAPKKKKKGLKLSLLLIIMFVVYVLVIILFRRGSHAAKVTAVPPTPKGLKEKHKGKTAAAAPKVKATPAPTAAPAAAAAEDEADEIEIEEVEVGSDL